MKIRLAKRDDLEGLVKVFRDCWTISYKDLLPLNVREDMTEDAARELLRKAVDITPERKTFVAEEDGLIIGMARVGIEGEKVHLFSLYVSPDASGKGVGSALMEMAFGDSTYRTLWVFKENSIAQGLYKKFGFDFTGAERIDPRWQIPEVEMLSTTQR